MAITEEAFATATRRATARLNQSPGVVKACVDLQEARVVLELNTGLVMAFPIQAIEGLSQAAPSDLQDINISPTGLGVHFPALDVDLYIPSLLQGFMGTRQWMAAQMGHTGGKATTPAKVAAARANGKLGGRPKKLKLAASDPA
jgi:hypothetical protein